MKNNELLQTAKGISYNHEDINKKALYTLSVAENGKFQTEYFAIPTNPSVSASFKNLQSEIQKRIIGTNLSKQEIYNLKTQMILDYWHDLKKNHAYLLGHRNYCSSIDSSYIYSPEILEDFNLEFLPFSEDSDDVRIKKSEKDSTKIEWLFSDAFFESYFIEQAYNESIRNKNIKAYSHRRLGWQSYYFVLNNIFSINIQTNFGYGMSSYFCVTLIYDGIQIIPYSRLVLYRNAGYMQLIRNTWDYYPSDGNWQLAFDMVKDACNCFQSEGQHNFIKEYFIDQLENLTNKLSVYLDINRFQLSENQYGNYICRNEENKQMVELDGFPLIIFRGEKVSGAVGFVESIKRVNKITPTQKYIDIITDCCKKVLPQLNSALEALKPKLEELEKTYKQECEKRDQLEAKFKEIEPQLEKYKEQGELIRKAVIDQTSKCFRIATELHTHYSYFRQITAYKKEIDFYLKGTHI